MKRLVESVIAETKLRDGSVRWSSWLIVDGKTVYERHFDPCPGRALRSLEEIFRSMGGKLKLHPLLVTGGLN